MSSAVKAVKKVFKSVTKVVKKVLPVVAVAAAVYFGGYALANGTLTGSGTHLASMFSGTAGAGSSLFVPGAGSQAAGMISSAGGSVGGGWLGGSGLPGFGTKESIASINSGIGTGTTATSQVATGANAAAGNTSLSAAADNAVMQNSFTGSQMPAGQFGTGATMDSAAMTLDGAAASNSVTPLAQTKLGAGLNSGNSLALNSATGGTNLGTNLASGVQNVGGSTLAGNSGNVIASTANKAVTTGVGNTGSPGLISRTWNNMGDFSKAALITTGGSALSGYATAKAEEDAQAAKLAEEDRIRNEELTRVNTFRAGRWEYVPGVGLRYRSPDELDAEADGTGGTFSYA